MIRSTGKRRGARVSRFAAVAVALTALAALTPTPTFADHLFKIMNRGDHRILEVHISATGTSSWGPDLLGNDYIDPGVSWSITIVQGCQEDIMLVYDQRNDITRESRDFDTCRYDLEASY